jgi:hypothetical protein
LRYYRGSCDLLPMQKVRPVHFSIVFWNAECENMDYKSTTYVFSRLFESAVCHFIMLSDMSSGNPPSLRVKNEWSSFIASKISCYAHHNTTITSSQGELSHYLLLHQCLPPSMATPIRRMKVPIIIRLLLPLPV